MGQVHQHKIDIETDQEAVTVTIGGDGASVPGGFAKLFNRVIDTGVWARLSDSAKSAYLPLVRFADHRNGFRIRLGQAALMKYSGLSRSSTKRAMKELLACKLVVLIEQGGVTEAGENESNLYQLMVPVESRPKRTGGSPADPQGGQGRTPSPAQLEPTPGPVADPPPARERTRPGAHRLAEGGSAPGPQLRNTLQEDSKTACPPTAARTPADLAAALLEEKGVEPHVGARLARDYPYERIVDVVATMEYRRARGKCDNPGGFIRDALVRQWPVPKAVFEARARAEAKLRQAEAERATRESAQRQAAEVTDHERHVEQTIAALDDDELDILAESVLAKYEGNAAVLKVLTRKPPRECRLMKMEIAAMLNGSGASHPGANARV